MWHRRGLILTVSVVLVASTLAALLSTAEVVQNIAGSIGEQSLIPNLKVRVVTDKQSYAQNGVVSVSIYLVNTGAEEVSLAITTVNILIYNAYGVPVGGASGYLDFGRLVKVAPGSESRITIWSGRLVGAQEIGGGVERYVLWPGKYTIKVSLPKYGIQGETSIEIK